MKNTQKIFFIWLMLCISRGHAALYGFCFDDQVKLSEAHQYLQQILLPRDEVFYRESKHCLEIELSEHRKELVEKFLFAKYRNLNVYGDDTINVMLIKENKTCKIQLIKKALSTPSQQEYSLGAKNKLASSSAKEESSSVMEMVLTQGLRGRLQMGDEEMEISCKELGNGKYQIEIFVKSGAENKTSQLSSSVIVDSNSPFEIGSVVRDLKKGDQKISLSDGYQKSDLTEKQNINFYILIK